MRNSSTGFLPPPHHGFGSRHPHGIGILAFGALTRWLRQATDRVIGAQLADDRVNPFLYLSPRC